MEESNFFLLTVFKPWIRQILIKEFPIQMKYMNLFNLISGHSASEIYFPNWVKNQIKSYNKENPKVRINGCKYLEISILLSIKNKVATAIASNKSKKLLLSKRVKNIETTKIIINNLVVLFHVIFLDSDFLPCPLSALDNKIFLE